MDNLLSKRPLLVFVLFLLCIPVPGEAQQMKGRRYQDTGEKWSLPLRGGFVYQFNSNLDDGGNFSSTRFFIQGGPTYSPAPRRSISLAVGYGHDGYDFSDGKALSPSPPWSDIHSLRFSVPVRWGLDDAWSVIAVPTIRFTAENGADWDEAATGGGFAGFSYRFSDRLSLGPGIGILDQLEESASVFPILVIRWKITDQLSLGTGGGLAATLGPGLSLNWQPSAKWDFMLGGRYEKLRFRLDKNGPNPGGIGEDSSFPLIFGATYKFDHKSRISVIGGLELGGELRLEDEEGRLMNKDNYDPAGFLGITFYHRF